MRMKQSVGLTRPDLRITDRVGLHSPDFLLLLSRSWQDKWSTRGHLPYTFWETWLLSQTWVAMSPQPIIGPVIWAS